VGAAQNDESAQGVREEDGVLPHQPSLKQVHRDAARRAEAKIILKALEMTHFNRKQTAQLLNITYRGLLYKIRECGIRKHLDWKEP
jgi:DNA-binding NtrC family response regulator